MPPKSKDQARRTGLNKYVFKVKKPESGTSTLKEAVPTVATKLKTPSKVTKPKAKPTATKTKAQSRVQRGRKACGHCWEPNVAEHIAAHEEHTDHKTADLMSAPVIRGTKAVVKRQNRTGGQGPSNAAQKPVLTLLAGSSATKSAASTAVKASSTVASITRSKVTKLQASSSRQAARTTSQKPSEMSAASTMVILHTQPSAMPLVANLSPKAASHTARTKPAGGLASIPANMAEARTGRTGPARSLSSEALPSVADEDVDVNTVGSIFPPPAVTMAMRSRTPAAAPLSKTLFGQTPSYVRQLRQAAHLSDTSIGDAEPTDLDLNKCAVSSPSVQDLQNNEPTKFPDLAMHRELRLMQSVKSASVHHQAVRTPSTAPLSTTSPTFTLASTVPKLVASSGGYDEYIVTTMYRVPHNSGLGPPQVTVAWSRSEALVPSNEPRSTEDDSSDDEPLVNRVAARAAARKEMAKTDSSAAHRKGDDERGCSALTPAAPLTSTHVSGSAITKRRREATTATCVEDAKTEAFEARRLSRRKSKRGRTPTPYHRGSPFHRLTPSRLKTPARRTPASRVTPLRRGAPASRTRPTPLKTTTVRRKEQWKKTTANMADYQRRRALFPRRPVFTQPIKEMNITLARLETFWKIMSDLIAKKKIFNRAMWNHWEYVSTCVRLINERMGAGEQFGMEEACAAARELNAQRLVMYTGGEKLMLTRNALSTRLS